MRLTEKYKKDYTLNEHYGMLTTGLKFALNKLGKLEDIEEELGIDFVTLAKGIKNGIYVKQGEEILKKELKEIIYSHGVSVHWESDGKQYDKHGAIVIYYGDYNSQYCDFNNVYTYGREWALTREELK